MVITQNSMRPVYVMACTTFILSVYSKFLVRTKHNFKG